MEKYKFIIDESIEKYLNWKIRDISSEIQKLQTLEKKLIEKGEKLIKIKRILKV